MKRKFEAVNLKNKLLFRKIDFVAIIFTLSFIAVVDFVIIWYFQQSPDRVAAMWSPQFGEYIYSFKTEMIIGIDMILFAVLFPLSRVSLAKILGRHNA